MPSYAANSVPMRVRVTGPSTKMHLLEESVGPYCSRIRNARRLVLAIASSAVMQGANAKARFDLDCAPCVQR